VYEYEKEIILTIFEGMIVPNLYLFHSLLLVVLDLNSKSYFKEASNALLFG
jgi:hypothetical protein